MQQSYHFFQIDVFTRKPFGGNQLAVFTDARGLEAEQMQALAREMNFSETTFILPATLPGAAKKVRIFTPAVELPMAGHPTVGTAAVLVQRGMVATEDGSLVLQLGIGPVLVETAQQEAQSVARLPFVWMNHQMPEFQGARSDRERVAAALGLEPGELRADLPLEIVSTGLPFLFVPLISLSAIARARSEINALTELFRGIEPAHVALFTEEVIDPSARFHARMFSPHLAGIVEDPATGSMAAPFGAYTARNGLLPAEPKVTFLMEQGIEMGRPSQITVEVGYTGGQFHSLRIGGDSVLVGEGDIFWE
jgi:trans-2,3-dihydro-3-hydroxyanthranilate isomerase